MLEIRIHGRGGQGIVTAAELLSVAAFLDGRHAQAFPSFGPERTGAPVVAFCRIDTKTIRSREPIAAPEVVVIADPTLLHQPGIFSGLVEGGWALLNSSRPAEELELGEVVEMAKVITVPATEIAMQHTGKPLPNAVLLGVVAAVCEQVSLESVGKAIDERFSEKVADANKKAAAQAYDLALQQARVLANA